MKESYYIEHTKYGSNGYERGNGYDKGQDAGTSAKSNQAVMQGKRTDLLWFVLQINHSFDNFDSHHRWFYKEPWNHHDYENL